MPGQLQRISGPETTDGKIHCSEVSESFFPVSSHFFSHLLSVRGLISLVEHANITFSPRSANSHTNFLLMGTASRRCHWCTQQLSQGARANTWGPWPWEAAGAASPPSAFLLWKDSPEGQQGGGAEAGELAAILKAFQTISSLQEKMFPSR